MPTLAEALGLLHERAQVMIEIKPESVTEDEAGGIEALTVEAVRRAGMTRDVALISFSRRALLRCRALAPEIPRGHLFGRGEPVGEILAGARTVGCRHRHAGEGHALRRSARPRPGGGHQGGDLGRRRPRGAAGRIARFDLYGIGSNRPGVLMEAIREMETGG